jgi:hypothetical protein
MLSSKLDQVPGVAVQMKSVSGFLPAAMNSPLAQSPMICIAAWPSPSARRPGVERRPADAQGNGLESRGFLPGLAAVRERHVAELLEALDEREERSQSSSTPRDARKLLIRKR